MYIRKLTEKNQQKGGKDAKKRPRAPDLSADTAPKKAAKKAAKAKAKPKAKSGLLNLGPETAEDMEACVGFHYVGFEDEETDAVPAGSRQRLWLDDMLSALEKCFAGPFAMLRKAPAAMSLCRIMISLGLEFAFTGTVVLKKKPAKVWSQASLSSLSMFPF